MTRARGWLRIVAAAIVLLAVGGTTGATVYGQTTPICFEGWMLNLPAVDFYHCYKPVTRDVMWSTNG